MGKHFREVLPKGQLDDIHRWKETNIGGGRGLELTCAGCGLYSATVLLRNREMCCLIKTQLEHKVRTIKAGTSETPANYDLSKTDKLAGSVVLGDGAVAPIRPQKCAAVFAHFPNSVPLYINAPGDS
ncbi:hypothetical protein J6590_024166 [Homalodisca vitripennis]|nr:hypothetical protein J6590_024166 [Homalodisca vitripennis]